MIIIPLMDKISIGSTVNSLTCFIPQQANLLLILYIVQKNNGNRQNYIMRIVITLSIIAAISLILILMS